MGIGDRAVRLARWVPGRVALALALGIAATLVSVAGGSGSRSIVAVAAGHPIGGSHVLAAPVTVNGGGAIGPAQVPTVTATPMRSDTFRTGQAADRVLGQSNLTANGEATTRNGLFGPQGVAVDPVSGKVFVADTFNSRVLRYAAIGLLANGADAEAVLGRPNFTSKGDTTTQSGLGFPVAVTVDGSGRLWVADTNNNRVLRFDNAATKANGAAADGVLGQANFTTKGYGGGASGLSQPTDVAMDPGGGLWVNDVGNNRVVRFDNAAAKPNGAAADGVLGQPDLTATGAATSQSGLNSPTGLAADPAGHLWVADFGNHRVLRFDSAATKPNGAPADGVLGQPDFTTGSAGLAPNSMDLPTGVAVDRHGRLFVTDFNNNRVLWFDAAASQANGASADGALGQASLTEQTAASTAEGLHGPTRVAVDGFNSVWVTDRTNNRLIHHSATVLAPVPTPATPMPTEIATPRPTEIATPLPTVTATPAVTATPTAPPTTGAPAPSGGPTTFANGQAADQIFYATSFPSGTGDFGPHGLAVDLTTGKLFVADATNHRVLRLAPPASPGDAITVEAVLGQPDPSGSQPGTARNQLNTPAGIAVDTAGRLWVADSYNHRVLRFDAAATKANGADADGVLGQPDFTSTASAKTRDGLNTPSAVAVDTSGRLWVLDAVNARVLRFDNAAAKPSGANADGVLGQPDFTTATPATSQRGMWPGQGIAVDGNGRLWVAEGFSNRVLRYDNAAAKPNGANADGVLGQPDFVTDGVFNPANVPPRQQRPTPNWFNNPHGVTLSSTGQLWLADANNNRLLRFDSAAAKPNGANADGVLGQPDFTTAAAADSAGGLAQPHAVAIDAAGNLWVADEGNQRLVRFAPQPARP